MVKSYNKDLFSSFKKSMGIAHQIFLKIDLSKNEKISIIKETHINHLLD